MVINAVYHSHGLTDQKKQRIPVSLGEGEFVDIFFARSKDKYGIAIDDYNGNLTKMIILDSINNVIKQNILLRQGLRKHRRMSRISSPRPAGASTLSGSWPGNTISSYKKTSAPRSFILFDSIVHDDTSCTHSSLKIIEDLYQE